MNGRNGVGNVCKAHVQTNNVSGTNNEGKVGNMSMSVQTMSHNPQINNVKTVLSKMVWVGKGWEGKGAMVTVEGTRGMVMGRGCKSSAQWNSSCTNKQSQLAQKEPGWQSTMCVWGLNRWGWGASGEERAK